ncbi:MAG: hypothetical protein M3R04_07650 [bacterium]|nr:hypothetical protein [bacterium]
MKHLRFSLVILLITACQACGGVIQQSATSPNHTGDATPGPDEPDALIAALDF